MELKTAATTLALVGQAAAALLRAAAKPTESPVLQIRAAVVVRRLAAVVMLGRPSAALGAPAS